MTQLNQVYKCNICGNIVEMVHIGAGQLVCCGQPMELLAEKTQDSGSEKHVPIVEKTAKGIKVKIGSVPHPMEKEHHIEWIEIIFNGKTGKKFLNPGLPADLPAEALTAKAGGPAKEGEEPEAEFEFVDAPETLVARAYCNVHGLWKN